MFIGQKPVRGQDYILEKESSWILLEKEMYGSDACQIIPSSFKVITLTERLVELLEMLYIRYIH